jgi:hypothetical protein
VFNLELVGEFSGFDAPIHGEEIDVMAFKPIFL